MTKQRAKKTIINIYKIDNIVELENKARQIHLAKPDIQPKVFKLLLEAIDTQSQILELRKNQSNLIIVDAELREGEVE